MPRYGIAVRFASDRHSQREIDEAADKCEYDVAKARLRSRSTGMAATVEKTRLLALCMKAKGFTVVGMKEEWQ